MTRTPKTLDEAIQEALCVGPLTEVKERAYAVMKDFCSQKITIAHLSLDKGDDPVKVLNDLFESLIRR